MPDVDVLLIITRGYASIGTYQDEFCTLWGLPKERKHSKWYHDDDMKVWVLIIHGCEDLDPVECFNGSLSENKNPPPNKVDIKKVIIFSHSIGQEITKLLVNNIEEKWSIDRDDIFQDTYSSGESLSVYNLIDKLSDIAQGDLFIEVIKNNLKGLTIFLYDLIQMQSLLLQFKLYLHTLAFENSNEIKNYEFTKPSMRLAERIDSEAYAYWIDQIPNEAIKLGYNKSEIEDINNSIKLLSIFREKANFENIKELNAGECWDSYNQPGFEKYILDKERKELIFNDFKLFARAIDRILKVTRLMRQKK